MNQVTTPGQAKSNQGLYGLSDSKAASVRNQNSATHSSTKVSGAVVLNGQQQYPHPTGSQRVRDKLLINSGGLALGQGGGQATAAAAAAARMHGVNSAQKSP